MEHIPSIHAAKVGMHYPAWVAAVGPTWLWLDLDLTTIAPGRSPILRADLRFDRTIAPEKVRALGLRDPLRVVLIEVDIDLRAYRLHASLPADPVWLTWNNGTVRRLAQRIRETGEYDLLPVLADALEEAGCTEHDLLARCRQPGGDDLSWLVTLLATQE